MPNFDSDLYCTAVQSRERTVCFLYTVTELGGSTPQKQSKIIDEYLIKFYLCSVKISYPYKIRGPNGLQKMAARTKSVDIHHKMQQDCLAFREMMRAANWRHQAGFGKNN